MSVDRNLLPPLPGKPAWYLEDAPQAVDPLTLVEYDANGLPIVPVLEPSWSDLPTQNESRLLPTSSAFEPPAFPTVAPQPPAGRGMGRVRALAGKLRH